MKTAYILQFKVETSVRSNTGLKRSILTPAIASVVTYCATQNRPDRQIRVDLSTPTLVVLVEVFKGVCGMSVIHDGLLYETAAKRYNMAAIVDAFNAEREQNNVTSEKTVETTSAMDES